MNIAIFGATGRTGQHLLRQALTQGHQVSILARDPAKAGEPHPNLRLVTGSLQSVDCTDEVIAGSQAVLSVLGPTHNKPTYEISQGMQQIISSMKKHGVSRLIISAGAGVGDPGDTPRLFHKFMNLLLKSTARYVYEDMLKTVDLVRSSGLDWTIVRVPMLTNDPQSGSIKVGMVGAGMGPRISRADFAAFMLKQLDEKEFLYQAPAISN